MLITPWLRSVKSVLRSKSRRLSKASSRSRRARETQLEPLASQVERMEDRTLLSVTAWFNDAAGELVMQTMLGSAHLLEKAGKTPAELRRGVTSPGGTTAAAVKVFEESGLATIVREAVRAAYNRAKELGK